MRSTFAKLWAACISCAALLSACATGKQFTRPAQDFVYLSVTTRAQIEARLGKPEEEQTERQNGLILTGTSYSETSEATTLPNGESEQPITGYQFSYAKRPMMQSKMLQKDLDALCDPVGVVRDVTYAEVGDQ